ncbi:MAG TPA: glycosyltransferase family 4 protein [Dongiaceae bacterium]|nr:glycosyltransferase family 4 protein [Dongiaceae bacterium]
MSAPPESPTKLLIYSHAFPPSLGGVETSVLSLATGLCLLPPVRGSFEVTVVTNTARGEHDDSSYLFRVVRGPGARQLFRAIRASDIVHVAGPALLPMFFCWLAKKPFVVEHHGYQAICPNGLLLQLPESRICPGYFQQGALHRCLRCGAAERSTARSAFRVVTTFLRRALSRRASANIAITDHVLRRHALPRATRIYYGIENLEWGPRTPRPDGRAFEFVFVGRFVPEKGIDLLLQAAQQLVLRGLDFQVHLVGDGPERARIEQRIAQLQLGSIVHCVGPLRGPDLAQFVLRTGAMVMPSVWEEAAGLSAIEQLMRGRLVIASDAGGLPEVVGSAGLLFPAGDAAALAEQMFKAATSPALVAELENSARARAVELFSWNRAVADHADVYRRVLSGNPA